MPTAAVSPPTLTSDQGQALVRLARLAIAERLGCPEQARALTALLADKLAAPVFRDQRGTFVTLQIKGRLRGCIGCLTSSESLLAGVKRNALAAACDDPRFPPLAAAELPQVEIAVSILTKPQPCAYLDNQDLLTKLQPEIDGVIIRRGLACATFLPQVWQQLPRAEDFLAHLCRKAGLPPDSWQNGGLEVETYQVQYFAEEK